MLMPIRTTSEDVIELTKYLKTKTSSVTLDTAKAAIDKSLLDSRKISAYRYWMILKDNDDNSLELSEYGRRLGRKPENQYEIFREIIKKIPPYFLVLEWAYYQKIKELSSIDTIVHWNEHSSDHVSPEESSAGYQAACFFRFCEGAGLGEMKIGRKGKPTRLVIDVDALTKLITDDIVDTKSEKSKKNETDPLPKEKNIPRAESVLPEIETIEQKLPQTPHSEELYKRVYITHGKNTDFVETLKRMLFYGELEPIVSVQTQSVSKPVPEKIMDEMRSCGAAIIHVDDERKLWDSEQKEIVLLNENVLIEIGAALALYGKRIILFVKEGVKLPSNLQGLYEVRYTGDKLDGEKTIELLEAINQLKQEIIPE